MGAFADKFGRRLSCLLFCVFYTLSCVSKHYPSYNILMVGRILGGVSTSILFSAFESWMVKQHHTLGFDSNLLGDTFQKAWGLNAVVAVIAGLLFFFNLIFYLFFFVCCFRMPCLFVEVSVFFFCIFFFQCCNE